MARNYDGNKRIPASVIKIVIKVFFAGQKKRVSCVFVELSDKTYTFTRIRRKYILYLFFRIYLSQID